METADERAAAVDKNIERELIEMDYRESTGAAPYDDAQGLSR